MKTALIAGATGLVGQLLLPRLLAAERYERVIVLSRRPLTLTHNKLTIVESELDQPALAAVAKQLQADDVFCCLGTTQKQHGGGQPGQAGLKMVDHNFVMNVATVAHQQGAQQFLLISALAANAKSTIYYNKIKGMAEDSLRALDYPSLHIFRPSLLIGDREKARPQDPRGGERFWQRTMPMFNLFMAGKMSRYRPTPADKVADAMLAKAAEETKGQHIQHFYADRIGE